MSDTIYLLIDKSDGQFAAHTMTMRQIAEYVVATFPIGAAVPVRIYRLLPNCEPQRMYLSRTTTKNMKVILSVDISDGYGNPCDSFSFSKFFSSDCQHNPA